LEEQIKRKQTTMEKHAVVGGGLVGCLQAIYLANAGFKVSIFERRPDPRRVELAAGRSINLALSKRGLTALEGAGVKISLADVSVPMQGRMMHSVEGELTFQPYGADGECIYSTSRLGLNKQLLDQCSAHKNIEIFFEHRCEAVDIRSNTLFFKDARGESIMHTFDRIFGVDGAFSIIRQALQRNERFNFSQEFMAHGYKELSIPAAKDGGYSLDKNALHIWPRGKFMLIALPNTNGTFTSTLFLPFEGDISFENLESRAQVQNFFEEFFADALEVMPELVDEFLRNPTSSLVTVKSQPWHYDDKIVLLGDAAHAIVPFYGQGMNCGFEDCRIFNELLEKAGGIISEDLFQNFSDSRVPNTNAIAELAIRNYLEMRDSTGNPMFLLRKKIERKISAKYPDLWTPLYSMVTFTNEPYSKALQASKRLDKIMDQVMLRPDVEFTWDSEEVENQILELLNVYVV